jgi:hypothetical protein
MKTAMQELIDELKRVQSMTNMNFVIRIATDLLEKEKEQICNSYVEGLEGLYMGAEEYYNKEYGQAGRTFTQDLIPKN